MQVMYTHGIVMSGILATENSEICHQIIHLLIKENACV